MKKLFAVLLLCCSSFQVLAQDLVITAVFDGPLSGGIPKGVELLALNDIADLSQYGIGSANNGGGTDGEEFTFPADSLSAGDYIYVATESAGFTTFLGFAPDYTSGAVSINGDDAIELFMSGGVIDVFGDPATDGTGQDWEYTDGWAARPGNTGTPSIVFDSSAWIFSGPNALDGETDNGTAVTPIPLGASSTTPSTSKILITAVFDGPLSGGVPKGVELLVLEDIADLSEYGLGSANNGGGSDGEEFSFLADSASAGDYLYVASEATGFTTFFGFAPNYTSGAMSINGDDAIELFFSG